MKLQGMVSQGFQLLSLYSKFSSLLNWLVTQSIPHILFLQTRGTVSNPIQLKCFIFHTDIIQCFVRLPVVLVQVKKCG